MGKGVTSMSCNKYLFSNQWFDSIDNSSGYSLTDYRDLGGEYSITTISGRSYTPRMEKLKEDGTLLHPPHIFYPELARTIMDYSF